MWKRPGIIEKSRPTKAPTKSPTGPASEKPAKLAPARADETAAVVPTAAAAPPIAQAAAFH